ncbi:MAG: HDOD domain-containing protein [Fimbriimonadaceae bacterium]|nr:HDOD domain-containing protein [Fimbriimonadaceae bacterium]
MDLQSLAIKVSRSENLPVLPQVVSSVIKLADDPNSSPKAMEAIIERDAGITAKILRVANSPYYGFSHVSSIGRAISVLGLSTIRSLVTAVAYQQLISSRASSQNFCKLEFWRHSLAVATGSRILAKIKNPSKAEELYSAGILHDVGMLVLERFSPAEFDSAIKNSHTDLMPIHEVENFMFGFDHAQVGGLLAEKWSLPPVMSHAIHYHHSVGDDPQYKETTAIVSIANTMAHQCGFANNMPKLEARYDETALELLGLPEGQLEVIKNVMIQEIERAQDVFQIRAA